MLRARFFEESWFFEMSDEDSVSESKEGIKLSLRNTPSNDENYSFNEKRKEKWVTRCELSQDLPETEQTIKSDTSSLSEKKSKLEK